MRITGFLMAGIVVSVSPLAIALDLPFASAALPAICEKNPRITPGERIGVLALGLQAHQVQALLGSPDFTRVVARGRAPASSPYILVYQDDDEADVTILGETVVMVALRGGSPLEHCVTAGGLYVGGPVHDITALLGQPNRYYSVAGGVFETWLYNNLGFLVNTERSGTKNIITGLTVFTPGQYCLITHDASFCTP